MAEPVVVPVQVEVTDIVMSDFNPADVQKAISSSLGNVRKSMEQVFSKIDPSKANKAILNGIQSIESRFTRLNNIQKAFYTEAARVGKSTDAYKKLADELKSAQEALTTLEGRRAIWENEDGDYTGTAEMWKDYLRTCEAYEAQLYKVQDLQKQLSDPSAFVKFADPADTMQLESLARKFASAAASYNQEAQKFNQIMVDNQAADEYKELIKQAEAYKKKLADLNEKSKEMEFKGAKDSAWENLRKETEWISFKMDEVLDKMRKAVKSGKAFRFGEGSKSDFNNQINSFGMSAQNNAGYTLERVSKNTDPLKKQLATLTSVMDRVRNIAVLTAKGFNMFTDTVHRTVPILGKLDSAMIRIAKSIGSSIVTKAKTLGSSISKGFGTATQAVHKFVPILGKIDGGIRKAGVAVGSFTKKAAGGFVNAIKGAGRFGPVLSVIASGFGKVLKVAGKVVTIIGKGFVGAVKVIGRVASAVGKVAAGFINLGKRIFSGIKNMNLFGRAGKKSTGDMNSRFKKLTKNFLMFGLGFRTAYYAIKRLRNIFIEGFKVMGDQFDEVGEPMKEMMESFNRLKGSLATAFQPLVSVVMPILTSFMNQLSAMLENFAKFTATLTGQKKIYKAVAKDISSVASAAKGANKELGSYDKLEVISQNNTGYEYEEQDISATEDAASSFAQMVKDAWENADFTSVGAFVTEKLIGILDGIETTLKDKVVGLVNKVLQSANTFLQGFDATAIGEKVGSLVNTLINGISWEQVGALFANLQNTIWGFIDGLVNSIDWTQLGTSLATGITSLFDTLDFEAWAGKISGLANGITTALFNMLTNVDWASVATKLGTAVNTLFTDLDLASIGTTIKTLFDKLWTFIGNFFKTVNWADVATNIAKGINNIFNGDSAAFDAAMPQVAEGLVTFVLTAIEQIEWAQIADTLFNGLMTVLNSIGTAMQNSDNPIMSAFGSVILALQESFEMLRPAIDSIIQAIGPIVMTILPIISELLPPIAEIISTAVQMVMPVLVALFEAFMPILSELMQILLPLALDLLTSLQPIFDAIVDTILPLLIKWMDTLMPLIESVLGLLTDILAPVLAILGPLLEIIFNVLDLVFTLLKPFISVLTTVCDVLGAVLRPILDALLPIMEAINSLFEVLSPILEILMLPLNAVAGMFKMVATLATGILVPALKAVQFIVDILANVVSMLAGVFKVAFGAIQWVINDLLKMIKTPFNALAGGLEWLANVVIKALNGMIGAMNKLSFDVPDWVPGLGGKKFGFNLKTISEVRIPRLAQGAVIPPNQEFLAMLGDQKHGTNIEAPLDTIKQALAEVMAEFGGAGSKEPIILQVNGRALAKVVWDEQEKRYKQTGKAAT